jgi:predicted secreted protein
MNATTKVLALGLVLVTFAACGSDSGGSSSSQNPDQTFTPTGGSTIKVDLGKPFVVKLKSNPTTGYSWATVGSTGTVKFLDSKYAPPKGNAAGAPGEQLLTFRATRPGSTKLNLRYRRPFAPTDDPKSLSFTVDAGN